MKTYDKIIISTEKNTDVPERRCSMYSVDIKTIFANALMQLLLSKPISDIPVKEITEIAGLSYRTFYNYFKDKYDLMHFVYYHINEQCWFNNGVPCGLIDSTTNFGLQTKNNIKLFYNMFKYVGQNDIRIFMFRKTVSDIRKIFVWNGYGEMLCDRQSQGVVHMLSYTLYGQMEHSCMNRVVSFQKNEYEPTVLDMLQYVPEPQKGILLSEPRESPVASKIRIYDPNHPSWPAELF